MVNKVLEALRAIDPSSLSYQEWVDIGMGLKAEGLPCSAWDEWSRGDSRRYHPGECERKWETFQGTGITAGTVVQMAKDHGWRPPRSEGRALDWDDVIELDDDSNLIDMSWLEKSEIKAPSDYDWNPSEELIRYLEALFDRDEYVGYVVDSNKRDDNKYVPGSKGSYSQTAGELIRKLRKYGNDIESTFGEYDKNAGAWIRFNPLDGHGVKNENVTDYRFALVESDSLDIESQKAIIEKLELPVAAMVYSGGKSIHAIVHIDAIDAREYKQRVEYLYEKLRNNKFDVDSQNKNPSRLSRMPGFVRGNKKQWLIETNIGKESFDEWKEKMEALDDDLPDFEDIDDVLDDLPELAPVLIDGILRQGHKMLLAGPSKAGKSFALIQLAIAIAGGGEWLGRRCAQGKVLYVNLEVDRTSFFHRIDDVYKRYNSRKGRKNLKAWNLRGEKVTIEKLVTSLEYRIKKGDFMAVIIDPIYKLIEGDENKAGDMAKFCNQFDRICNNLGCAVIYCHHHSKGAKDNATAMNRASGSGVFARDPDALLDMVEVDLPLEEGFPDGCTGWRISSVLREFRSPAPYEVFFDYPVHVVTDLLRDAKIKGGDKPQKKTFSDYNEDRQEEKEENIQKLIKLAETYPKDNSSRPLPMKEAMEKLHRSEKSIERYVESSNGELEISKAASGKIIFKSRKE